MERAGRWADLACKARHSEKQRRVCQTVDEPGGGDARHPSADYRNALAEKEELKVSVP